jgi:4-diphosphocytidyl-2-C-methyl-D-erythritol kinase
MTVSRHWPAPAKLNLFLHITGRRDDGYHLLQTAFQILDYGDSLDFSVRGDGTISRQRELPGVSEDDDLTLKAARLLQAQTSTPLGVAIDLHKRLPMGGGLGGGSSDCATVLVALNHLWDTGLEVAELARIGLQLGADVPVFVEGHSAWAEGVGELLQPITLPESWFVVLIPDVNVSTAGIFSDPALKRDTPAITIPTFLSGGGRNDCEPIVARRYPEVAAALEWLSGHAPARMTGTGACVFAAFDDEQQARRVLDSAAGRWNGFVARGLNESPLRHRLEQARRSGAGNS